MLNSWLLALWASSALALPTGTGSRNAEGCSADIEHVILLDRHKTTSEAVLQQIGLSLGHDAVTHIFNSSVFKGFSAKLTASEYDTVTALNGVTHLEQSREVRIMAFDNEVVTRSLAPWGLQRISSNIEVSGNPTAATFAYAFENSRLGQGVDIYVVDTGIYGANEQFTDNRVYPGWAFGDSDIWDDQGHGTHVSGTAAGSTLGVASNANLVAIKVLDSTGVGTTANTIAGLDKVVQFHEYRKTQPGWIGSVLSMSWGLDGPSSAINAAVQAASDAGIHVAIAAGNEGANACDYSPSQLGGLTSKNIISVGAVGQTDDVSSFSNTGQCVDIYAPGENVLSSWIGDSTAIKVLSGTSMATPHVSGLMAYLMVANSSLASDTALMKTTILSMGARFNDQNDLMINNGAQDPSNRF